LIALAAGAGVLIVGLVTILIALWSSLPIPSEQPGLEQNTGSSSPPAVAPAPAGIPSPGDGPRIQIGPTGAPPEPPAPRKLPTMPPENLPPGQTISLGEGRFTIWVPTEEQLAEKLEGSGADLFRYFDLTAANGAAIRVMATYGSNAEHTRDSIQTARELAGKPRSILEEPWTVIEQQGIIGLATEKPRQRYTKASRRREFYYEGVGLVVSVGGSEEQVNSPQIDWLFGSIVFGQPDP
jgi:hypothetical protein